MLFVWPLRSSNDFHSAMDLCSRYHLPASPVRTVT
jgi:hypothetical protein